MPRRSGRSDDELHLEWLRHRQEGHRITDIAASYGEKSERVRVVIGRVKNEYAASAGGENVFGCADVQ